MHEIGQESCAMRECSATAAPVFCAEHFSQILEGAARHVSGVRNIASEFYFGRSSFPERRLLEHVKDGRNHLLVLHWAANWPEIELLEESLIRRYTEVQEGAKHLRLKNEGATSRGAHTSPWTALYVSFAPKHDVKFLPGAVRVDALHWRNRTWPSASLPLMPVLLRTEMSASASAAEVGRFREATRATRFFGAAR